MKINYTEEIKKLANHLVSEITEIRRHLHMYPELSFEEVETSKFIQKKLEEYQIPFEANWAINGVVATISGNLPSDRVIALRGDIDALPIQEQNTVSYKSKNEGKMHACGHDVHTSCVLGAGMILNQLRDQFGGTIKLIFQPGEEKLPGGASLLIKEGVLKNPEVEKIYGQHVHPPLEAGKVGVKPGPFMASADEIYITIIGRSGHGALPDECVDTILIASQVVVALQSIVARKISPLVPSVLTIGKIYSDGGATNIIPGKVFLEGTFRTMDESWRANAHQEIEILVGSICKSMGGDCNIEIRRGYPSLKNDEAMTFDAKRRIINYLGEENVVDLPIRMTAEDFAYYSQQVPACFYRLGTGNKDKGITSPVHTPTFDIDEKALEIGAGLMAYLAITELSS